MRRAGQRLCHGLGGENVMRIKLRDAIVGQQENHVAVSHAGHDVVAVERRCRIVPAAAGPAGDRRGRLGRIVILNVVVIVVHIIAYAREGRDAVAGGVEDDLTVVEGDGVEAGDVERRRHLLQQVEVQQRAVVLHNLLQLALQQHFVVLELQPLLLDAQAGEQAISLGRRRLMFQQGQREFGLRQVGANVANLKRGNVINKFGFDLGLERGAALEDLQEEVALLEHQVLELGELLLHLYQFGEDVVVNGFFGFVQALHSVVSMVFGAGACSTHQHVALEAPQAVGHGVR